MVKAGGKARRVAQRAGRRLALVPEHWGRAEVSPTGSRGQHLGDLNVMRWNVSFIPWAVGSH